MRQDTTLQEFECIVLKKEQAAEGYAKLHLFSAQEGLQTCLERISKRNTRIQSDLFDTALVELNPSSTGSCFLKTYTVLNRVKSIATDYNTLKDLSFYANLICTNLTHTTDSLKHFELLQKSLHAWETGLGKSHILFKTLYCFVQIEGYPVKQDWLVSLPEDLQQAASQSLQTPLKELEQTKIHSKLFTNLLHWVARKTELRMPTPPSPAS